VVDYGRLLLTKAIYGVFFAFIFGIAVIIGVKRPVFSSLLCARPQWPILVKFCVLCFVFCFVLLVLFCFILKLNSNLANASVDWNCRIWCYLIILFIAIPSIIPFLQFCEINSRLLHNAPRSNYTNPTLDHILFGQQFDWIYVSHTNISKCFNFSQYLMWVASVSSRLSWENASRAHFDAFSFLFLPWRQPVAFLALP
jgi:hypothetical protein